MQISYQVNAVKLQRSTDHKTNCHHVFVLNFAIFMIIYTLFAEPIYIHSTIPNILKPSKPLLKQRKKQDLETEAKTDQTKPGKLKEDVKLYYIQYSHNVEQ